MRFEKLDNDIYKVFINSFYLDDFDINDNSELGKYIKKIILKIRKIYNVILEGFYEVHVYILKNIGLILEIKNIDKYLSKTIDLKIIVHNDEEIYLKTDEYELLSKQENIKYLDDYFYIDINYMDENNYFKIIEYYEVIYGENLDILKKKWYEL